MSKENLSTGGEVVSGMVTGNIFVRIIMYFIMSGSVLFFLYVIGDSSYGKIPLTGNYELNKILFLVVFFVPPIFIEFLVIRSRKKLGLSIYKNISEELKQRVVDEQVARENKAKENLGISEEEGSVDKDDLNYWHRLLKDGAISQEEYDSKKRELL